MHVNINLYTRLTGDAQVNRQQDSSPTTICLSSTPLCTIHASLYSHVNQPVCARIQALPPTCTRIATLCDTARAIISRWVVVRYPATLCSLPLGWAWRKVRGRARGDGACGCTASTCEANGGDDAAENGWMGWLLDSRSCSMRAVGARVIKIEGWRKGDGNVYMHDTDACMYFLPLTCEQFVQIIGKCNVGWIFGTDLGIQLPQRTHTVNQATH